VAFELGDAVKAAQQTIGKNIAEGGNFAEGLRDFLDVVAAHESDATTEASRYVDLVWRSAFDSWNEAIALYPDSVDKRRVMRMLAAAEGKHPSADRQLQKLCQIGAEAAQSAEAGLVVGLMQHTLDMLHDLTTGGVLNGAAQVSIATLLYWAVDELAAAFHLARCNYSTQANAHIRTVFEILDKAELFFKRPEFAEVWASGDERRAWNELRPEEVRKKLGRSKGDVFFTYLSNVGTHATFSGLQRRTLMSDSGTGPQAIGIAVGGVKRVEERMFSVLGCVVASALTVLRTAVLLKDCLMEEEARKIVSETKQSVDELLSARAQAPADENVQRLIEYWQSSNDLGSLPTLP
jgi:hypothetical protein